MGMSVGSGGGGDAEPMMDINTTPLIDVMLVLLIMFIITIPIQLHSVNVNMPVGDPPRSQVEPVKIRLDINEESKIFWDAQQVVDATDLENRLRGAATSPDNPVLIIRPDKRARYETVAHVLAAVQRAGVGRMTIAGAEQFVE